MPSSTTMNMFDVSLQPDSVVYRVGFGFRLLCVDDIDSLNGKLFSPSG